MLSCFSCVRLFVTPWTVALQAPLSVGFPRQEYWSGLPFPSPGNLPDPGLNLGLLHCNTGQEALPSSQVSASAWGRGTRAGRAVVSLLKTGCQTLF